MILLIKLIFLHFFLIRKTLKDKDLNKALKAYSNDLIVLVEKDLVAIWIRKVLYFKASNETLEAYYIIMIAGVACFVLSLVCQWIDYVNCSILEQFLNFNNLPFHYNIRRGCLFNNPFSSPISKRLVVKRDKPWLYSLID